MEEDDIGHKTYTGTQSFIHMYLYSLALLLNVDWLIQSNSSKLLTTYEILKERVILFIIIRDVF